jgi:NTE family protein
MPKRAFRGAQARRWSEARQPAHNSSAGEKLRRAQRGAGRGTALASALAMLGLVLTAGGARGAYQAGVLERVAELPALRGRPSPFRIVAGASAGAINGAMIAARGERFAPAAQALAQVWRSLHAQRVYRADLAAIACAAAGLGRDLALGGLTGSTVTSGLLDASPLAETLRGAFPARGVANAIRRGDLHAVAISATSYHSGRSFTFVQGRRGHAVWQKSRRVVLPVTLTHRHILASAAIPGVFRPVSLSTPAGEAWFGDGGLRLVAPLSPAIRLGARHVLAIGVRSTSAASVLAREEADSAPARAPGRRLASPPLAQVFGVFMNAIFLDHLDADVDHLRRMNALVAQHDARALAAHDEGIRHVEPLVLGPSEDLALIAKRFEHRLPRALRFLLAGLGTPDAQSADLNSYLLFDAAYTETLVDLGRRDAEKRIDEIEAFLAAAGALDKRAQPRRRAAPPLARVVAAVPA